MTSSACLSGCLLVVFFIQHQSATDFSGHNHLLFNPSFLLRCAQVLWLVTSLILVACAIMSIDIRVRPGRF